MTTYLEIKKFKELHSKCDLKVYTINIDGTLALLCINQQCQEYPDDIEVTIPYESCRNKVKCAGRGSCYEDPACNN